MALDRPIRVVVGKPGLDGHDRGARVVACALRDAGMEVIYTGLYQTPEQIAWVALQEDADVVGLSILAGSYITLLPEVVRLLREGGGENILVTAGGIILERDIPALKEAGIAEIFSPGTSTDDIVAYIKDHVSVVS